MNTAFARALPGNVPGRLSSNNYSGTLLTLLLCIAFTQANAQSLSLSDTSALQNTDIEIPINVTGSPASGGFNATVNLPLMPAGLSVLNGTLIPAPDFDLQSFQSGLELRILAYSATNTFNGSGELARLLLTVPDDATPGLYPLAFAASNPDPLVNSRMWAVRS